VRSVKPAKIARPQVRQPRSGEQLHLPLSFAKQKAFDVEHRREALLLIQRAAQAQG